MKYEFQSSATQATKFFLGKAIEATKNNGDIHNVQQKRAIYPGIQPEDHPLIRDTKYESVVKLNLGERYSADGKYASVGAISLIMDEATTTLCTAMHPKVVPSSSVTMDFKLIKQIPIKEDIYMLMRLVQPPAQFGLIFFEFFYKDQKLIAYGNHYKAYYGKSYMSGERL